MGASWVPKYGQNDVSKWGNVEIMLILRHLSGDFCSDSRSVAPKSVLALVPGTGTIIR